MQFHVITIFPQMLESYVHDSILGRAQKNGLIRICTHNLREYTTNRHGKVDDTPYGGGAGMVLQVQPISACVEKIKKLIAKNKKDNLPNVGPRPPLGVAPGAKMRVILFSAKGKKYTQRTAERLSKYDNLILICGRYEGVDERVAEHIADEEISIGDYVLTGGELPAMVVIDSLARLVPGVLGNAESAKEESHKEKNYKEHAQYTKPASFQGWNVPEILLSGNHNEIKKWREKK